MEDAVLFTNILNNVFDDKISPNQHICVKHLLELVVTIHITLHFKHTLLSVLEQGMVQIVIVYLLDSLLINISSLS